MSEKYRPSNSDEGMWFEESFCFQCERDAKYQETGCGEDGCIIIASALLFNITNPNYPSEWIYDEHGNPTCTAFIPKGEPIKERCEHTADMFVEAGG